ncbi:glycoside hydrolase family 76 protein [Hyaloscypha variabilis F]|uniref:Mannan endo-1,6-alpha-mannosidase n=1 Tax=Hyaloscypha variabilis (strain UAMH 11265 / GT02V1 / F) TaxID=1149755 RepID=A0A2J6RRL7_HYAVF|nr:glycoside hydrolase family 76 protein [Hyaloscypha variabilis F]
MVRVLPLFALAALSFSPVRGIELDVTSVDSIKSAASSLASQLVSYYTANSTGRATGILPSPYNWWEAGALFDTLIQYSHLTGDTQYDSLIETGLLSQVGSNSDFMPVNQSATEGNDDQATWALAAMSAAEAQFTNSNNTNTKWLTLADTVFNILTQRWDTSTCSGGLRWQIYSFNQGFDYKNTASNGHFFQLASRLARFTGNATYETWANVAYNWTKGAGFIDSKWNVYDGASIVNANCSDITKIQFSYTAGSYLSGVAHMYNLTNGNSKWKTELDGLLNRTLSVFWENGTVKAATEIACEKTESCTIDMIPMKGLLGHWLADTLQMAPYTTATISSLYTSSAQAAAAACDDTGCSEYWDGKHTGTGGNSTGDVGTSIDALSFVQGLLWQDAGLDGLPATVNGTAVAPPNTTTTATGAGATATKKSEGMAMRAGMGVLSGVLGSMMWLML